MIYRYQKTTDEYTTYTLTGDNVTELVTLDGWTYVVAPDALPEQHPVIANTIESVELTPEQNLQIKIASPVVKAKLDKINQEVNAYINNHYDTGTQSSFNGIYSKRDTPDAVKDALDTVWEWISSIMSYYYGKKNDILTLESFDEVTWDFSQFDATKPNVSLAGLMG